jgi:quercetin dioxygenase-like cupin family protein
VEPSVSKPGEGERFERANRTLTIRVDLPEFSATEIEFDDTFEVPPHTHDEEVDAFYVLDGQVEFTAGEETVRVGPGAMVVAPPGARHGFKAVGGRARVLNVHAPDAGFTDSIRNYSPS